MLRTETRHRIFRFRTTLTLILILICSTLLLFTSRAGGGVSPQPSVTDYSSLIQSVNITEVMQHAMFLTNLGTRATGYEGNRLAREYIFNEFLNYELKNVDYYNFTVVDAIDHGANITIPGISPITIYPLRPNLVCPSTTLPEGITGPLIYASQGYLEDFDGKEVNGSIVLMDWYTKDRWVNAAKLGAKAVIFLPPTRVICSQWELDPNTYSLKYLPNTPLNFPRFYVPKPDADTLLDHLGEEVRVRSTQTWEEFTGRNVMGWINGTDYPDSIVVLSSYYDSYSVAPSIAPGAQEALGVASLLELAKYLHDHPPKHTVLFIAFGAHHQALTGATMFLNDYLSPFRKGSGLPVIGSGTEFAEKFVVHLNLDISTGSNVVLFNANSKVWAQQYSIYMGEGLSEDAWQSMGYPKMNKGYLWHLLQEKVNPWRRSLDGKTYRVMFATPGNMHGTRDEADYAPAMPWRDFAYDHEPHVPMRTGGYTFTTAFDPRPYYGTPFDTLTNLDAQALNNLQTQLEFIRISIASLLDEDLDDNLEFENPDLKTMMAAFHGMRVNYPGSTQDPSWIRIRGNVATWSTVKAWYEVWHNEPARALVYMEGAGGGIIRGACHRRFTFTGDQGDFEFYGASAYYGHVWFISPWLVNSTTGNVIYAPDHGLYSWEPHGVTVEIEWKWNITQDIGYLTMFKASTMVFFDMVVSTYLTLYEVETPQAPWAPTFPRIFVYRSGVHLEPESWSQWPYGDTAVVLAVPSNLPIEVIWKFPVQRYPHGLLLNPTPELPMGIGYTLQHGEQLILPLTNLKYAETFHALNEERLQVVGGYVPDLSDLEPHKQHVRAGDLIQEAHDALKAPAYEYSKAYSDAAEAWRLSQVAYLYARPWIEDASLTVVFLAALLIPFVFLAEKLLFNQRDLKRIASYLGIFAFIVAAFYLLHPGFRLAASPMMIIIGFSTLVLSAPLLLIVVRYVAAFINEIRLRRLGKHEAEVSRLGEVGHAFMTGVENMRKMRLRTILTLVSIFIMVAALCNVTSISAILVPQAVTKVKDVETLYEGVYIHKDHWGQGTFRIPEEAVGLLKVRYGDQAFIAPRAWRYTNYRIQNRGPGREYQWDQWRGEYAGFRLYYNGKNITSAILWGLTPQEKDLGWPELAAGDWFVPDVRGTIILTDVQAEALGIPTDPLEFTPVNVVFEGANYTVIGVIATETPLPFEIDMEDMTPIMTYEEPTPMYETHVELRDEGLPSWLSHILIMCYEDVITLGGETASVSMEFKAPTQDLVEDAAADIFGLLSGYQVYSSFGGEIKLHFKGFVVAVWGLQYQAIPMVVVFLAVFNIMLGTVHERKRDIAIYGTVGLSPLHIAFMFLAESTVYALLGGVLGYLFALLQGQLLGMFVQGIILNYSSSWVIISVVAAMGATLLSALYPIILASRLVTPSLERVWKVPTKPVKDTWEIPLPFYAPQARESGGILAFLKEYVEPHLIKDAPDFSVSNIATAKGEREGQPYLELSMDSRLFPYEIGVTQKASIYMIKIEPTKWESRLVLRRTGGPPKDWVRYGRNFIDLLRKQMLLWRTMTAPEKERYAGRFKEGGGS